MHIYVFEREYSASPACSIGICNSGDYIRVHCVLLKAELCRLEAKPDTKGKNKITDISTRSEGEPSQVAPDISNEETAKVFCQVNHFQCSLNG